MDDPLIAAFRSLCDRVGGFKAVAAKIDANDQSLYQVYAGVRLPSGRPKGVGPKLRERLDAAYPGWQSNAAPSQPSSQSTSPEPALLTALRTLQSALQEAPPAMRPAVAALLRGFTEDPSQVEGTYTALAAMAKATPFVSPPLRQEEKAR